MRQCEVPIIASFTKYDQFLFNVEMDVLDYPDKYSGSVSEEVEKRFQEHYLHPLTPLDDNGVRRDARYLCLQSGFQTYMLGQLGHMLMTSLAEMHLSSSLLNGCTVAHGSLESE